MKMIVVVLKHPWHVNNQSLAIFLWFCKYKEVRDPINHHPVIQIHASDGVCARASHYHSEKEFFAEHIEFPPVGTP